MAEISADRFPSKIFFANILAKKLVGSISKKIEGKNPEFCTPPKKKKKANFLRGVLVILDLFQKCFKMVKSNKKILFCTFKMVQNNLRIDITVHKKIDFEEKSFFFHLKLKTVSVRNSCELFVFQDSHEN